MSWKIDKANLEMYLSLSEKSAVGDTFFNNFRLIPQLEAIRGYCPSGFINQCYKDVRKYAPELLSEDNKRIVSRIDKIGSPQVIHDILSGDTWKSLQTAAIIKKYIGNVSGEVIEFGSNYGNLTHVLLSLFPDISTYTTIDYPEVQLLSQRVLKQSLSEDLYHKIRLSNNNSSKPFLYISEYCLTEQEDNELISLTENINSQWIWIRCNINSRSFVSHFENMLRTKYELVFVENEFPTYRFPNRLILGRLY